MENQEADGLETCAFRTISISVGIGSNYKEKCFKKLSCNMVSPCSCRVWRSSFAEANKRLQKLDRDYQHTNEKYIKLQSEWYRHCAGRWYRYCDRGSNHYSRWIGYCISQSEDAVEQLQMVLDKLNTEEEAPKSGRDTSSNSKQFFLMHGCKSMTQEKMKLRLKSENKEEYNDDMSQETIDVQRINDKLNYLQRVIPKITSKKPIHDLLRPIKEMKMLMEKAILNGALVGNHTSQDDMKNSTSIEIKLLMKLMRDLEKEKEKEETEKEKGETSNNLQGKRKFEKGYKENMRHLQEKLQGIDEKRDAEKKYILDLKSFFNSTHKTASQPCEKAVEKG